jgi:hypothetical protein
LAKSPEIGGGVAGKTVSELIAGIAVVGAFGASSLLDILEVSGRAIAVAVGVRPHEGVLGAVSAYVIRETDSAGGGTRFDHSKRGACQQSANRLLEHFIVPIQRDTSSN